MQLWLKLRGFGFKECRDLGLGRRWLFEKRGDELVLALFFDFEQKWFACRRRGRRRGRARARYGAGA